MEEAGKILPRLLKRHVRGAHAPLLAVLAPLWPRLAGKALAQHARPTAFDAGTLTLATSCPSWATELHRLREEIRAVINSAFGQPLVERLRVRLAPEIGAKPEDSAGSESAILDTGVPPGVGRLWKCMESPVWTDAEANLPPELREVLARSFAKYFARDAARIN